MAQIKGAQKLFFNSGCRNESDSFELVTLANFAKLHPQTTEIQPFKAECFSTKMLKFQHVDVIISDIVEISEFSLACGIDLL